MRTGFVRVVLPTATESPRVEDIDVVWKGKSQKVSRVLGGTAGPLELGIALDLSASMQGSVESLQRALLMFVDRGIASQDRVFVVSFTNSTRLVAEGRGDAARVLRSSPGEPGAGAEPTAFFDALLRTFTVFENADARAVLLVVSDGCDTSGGPASAAQAARRAQDLAIPVFVLLPQLDECRKTTCTPKPGGGWDCTSSPAPALAPTYSSPANLDPAARRMELSHDSSIGLVTVERDRFLGRIAEAGGDSFVVRTPEDWQKALGRIFERLGRQWTVVYEPSSEKVRSADVKVFVKIEGRRRRVR